MQSRRRTNTSEKVNKLLHPLFVYSVRICYIILTLQNTSLFWCDAMIMASELLIFLIHCLKWLFQQNWRRKILQSVNRVIKNQVSRPLKYPRWSVFASIAFKKNYLSYLDLSRGLPLYLSEKSGFLFDECRLMALWSMPPLETLRKLYQVFSDFLNDANCLRFTYLCDYSRQNICGMFLASLQMLSKNVATDLDSQSASTEPCRRESHCSLSSKDNHRNSKFIGEFIVPIYTRRIRHCTLEV